MTIEKLNIANELESQIREIEESLSRIQDIKIRMDRAPKDSLSISFSIPKDDYDRYLAVSTSIGSRDLLLIFEGSLTTKLKDIKERFENL